MGPFMQDAFKKIAEQSEKQEQSEIAELQQEITELHRQLAESEKGEREAQEYGEHISHQLRQHMKEANEKITKLEDMVENLTEQRDNLLKAYYDEVIG